MTKKDEEFITSMGGLLHTLDPGHRKLAEDMLKSYAWFSRKMDMMTDMVDREGAIVETEKGPKEHPAVSTIHKLSQRKADYFTRLMRLMPDGPDPDDELDDFLRG